MVGIIIIGLIILVAVAIYLLYMLTYIGAVKSFKSAYRADAVVVEVLDGLSMAVSATRTGGVIRRKYGKYKVSFWVNNMQIIKEAKVKNSKLRVGDHLEVSYEYDEKEGYKILSEALLCWVRQMFWGYTGGIVLGVVLGILKCNEII